MRMLIRYPNGNRVEAVLLAADGERMLIVVESQPDAVELSLVNGCWYTEAGEAIELEALISIPETDWERFCTGGKAA